MEKFEVTDEILFDYIDGTLSPGQKERVDGVCEKDEKLRKRLAELQKLDLMLSQTTGTPSPTFTDTAWRRLQPTAGRTSKYGLNSLFLLLGVVVTVIIGSLYIPDSVVEMDLAWVFEPTENYIKTPEIDLTQGIDLKVLTQGMLFSLVILALLFLDKALLRPYFKKRRAMISGL